LSINCPVVSIDAAYLSYVVQTLSLYLGNNETQHVREVKWNYAEDELRMQIDMKSKVGIGQSAI